MRSVDMYSSHHCYLIQMLLHRTRHLIFTLTKTEVKSKGLWISVLLILYNKYKSVQIDLRLVVHHNTILTCILKVSSSVAFDQMFFFKLMLRIA